MPAPWYVDDVSFNHAAADALCDAAAALAQHLEAASIARYRAGRVALEHCAGPFADELEQQLLRCCQEGAELADELWSMVGEVRATQRLAAAEQRNRVAARTEAAHADQVSSGDFRQAGAA